ncbi:hypothetical protein [Caballeronia sp. DA-9]|uniref:hypothetical protein n=1 Tax=Caballeronia sp. DA-9 TaxID=3436237 RepID=UPI003F674874
MLLPLPVTKVRSMALENHLALATLRSGHGGSQQMLCLLKVVYLAYFLREKGRQGGEIELFRAAELALQQSISCAECGKTWSLSEAGQIALESILALHDQQLGTAPAHVYEAAWERLQRFVQSDVRSPIQAATTDLP